LDIKIAYGQGKERMFSQSIKGEIPNLNISTLLY